MSATIFEPTRVPSSGIWLCPCKDAFGSAARLVEKSGDQVAEDTIRNFVCDQNGDRWQQMTGPDGAIHWQYVGRPVLS